MPGYWTQDTNDRSPGYLWDRKDAKIWGPVEETVKLAAVKTLLHNQKIPRTLFFSLPKTIKNALTAKHSYLIRIGESLTTRCAEVPELDCFVEKCTIVDPGYRKRVTKEDMQAIVN